MIQKRKGFTLIELLIVIVVIGILSAMMMFSSTEAVSSAKASNIIANMRNLRTAAIAWYADNESRVVFRKEGQYYGYRVDGVADAFNTIKKTSLLGGNHTKPSNLRSEIIKYITGDGASNIDDCYQFATRDYKHWYVMYKMGNDLKKIDKRVQDKLKGRAKSVGLIKYSPDNNSTYKEDYFDGTYNKYEKGFYVAMKIMSF